jgi:hypothetical protein
VSTTASNYILAIDENFPVAGQNNDTRGFRYNFSNIKAALSATNIEVSDLQINSMQQYQDNNFGGYAVKNANLVNPSITVAPKSDGTVPIDYSQANFWPITLPYSGINTVNIVNMPGQQRSGNLVVSVSTSSLYTKILFTATTGTVISLGPQDQPFSLTSSDPYLFEIWNDFSGDIPYIYVKKLTEEITESVYSNSQVSSDSFVGNNAFFKHSISIGNNQFTTGTVNGSVGATIVTDGEHYGNIALVPNLVSATIDYTQNYLSAGQTGTHFAVVDPTGIQVSAKFYFPNTSTQYTVSRLSGNVVYTTESFRVEDYPQDYDYPIVFINKQFSEFQNPLMTMTPVAALDDYGTMFTGTTFNLQGSVYANQTSLQITYADPNTATNTFSINKAITATDTTSNDLATVGYVHAMMPMGAVIMWYDSQFNIPYGWVLCDGSVAPNGVTTPNLSNQFVIGATSDAGGPGPGGIVPATDITGFQTTIGGTSTSILVTHNHVGTGTTYAINDPGHQHLGVGANTNSMPQPTGPYGNGPNGSGNWGFNEYTSANATQWWTSKEYVFADQYGATAQGGGVTLQTDVTISVSTGTVDGTYANLPPYTALYYIYKWISAGPALVASEQIYVPPPPPPPPPTYSEIVTGVSSVSVNQLFYLNISGGQPNTGYTWSGPGGAGTGTLDSSGNSRFVAGPIDIAGSYIYVFNFSATGDQVQYAVTAGTPASLRVVNITDVGTTSWTVPATLRNGIVNVTIIGGGGGGGAGSTSNDNQGAGGGGGAGGVVTQSGIIVNPGDTYSIIVGGGGAGASANSGQAGSTGGCSSAFGFTAYGGGGGGGIYAGANNGGGASGGGGAASGDTGSQGGAGGGSQGNSGGGGSSDGRSYDAGGGGGGAGAVGSGAGGHQAGSGGGGVYVHLLNSYAAGGGAGGRHASTNTGSGGQGGGGASSQNATSYGSGGGGGGTAQDGGYNATGSGYQGIVLIQGIW